MWGRGWDITYNRGESDSERRGASSDNEQGGLVFLIRRARVEDVGTLLKLAKMVHFINLPADRDIITAKVMRGREGFLKALSTGGGKAETGNSESAGRNGAAGGKRHVAAGRGASWDAGLSSLIQASDLFMFVLEDLTVADEKGGGVLGTSQIITKMGGPGRPNVSFKLSRKEMFSSTLQVGATHIVAKLHLDETSPTEIGGLILQPSYRGHKLRLGRFLSLVRFHVMGLYRPLFSDRVLAEMMGPLTPDGHNTMWEYLGRRFINLSYTEADSFCQYSKEFMTSLLPREEIYLTLLPPEARAVIGQVGPETIPARRMLEKLGFEYRDHVDPFDGGPHIEAVTDQITLVRETRRGTIGEPAAQSKCDKHGFVSVLDGDGEFRALDTAFCVDKQGRVSLTRGQMKIMGAEEGMSAGYTPVLTGAGAGSSGAKGRRKG